MDAGTGPDADSRIRKTDAGTAAVSMCEMRYLLRRTIQAHPMLPQMRGAGKS